eukprot:g5244.t1
MSLRSVLVQHKWKILLGAQGIYTVFLIKDRIALVESFNAERGEPIASEVEAKEIRTARSEAGSSAGGGRDDAVSSNTTLRAKARGRSVGGDGTDALEHAVASIERQFGAGSVMKLGDKSITLGPSDVIPTGSLKVDQALGVGGLPRGRICEIYGPEASGKTTLALHVIAEAQRRGGKCVFVDAEHAIDPSYADSIGVDVEELYISQPDSGEQALEIADTLARSGGVDVVVVDSVAALVPKAELEGEMGDAHMALQARLMSQAMRKMTPALHKSNTLLIFINQIRSKIGVMFGSPEVTAGGNALKFYSSVRIDIRRTSQQVTLNGSVVGHVTKVKVVKNKVAPPFGETTFDMIYGKGISRLGEMIDLGVEHGILSKRGAYFYRSLGPDTEDGPNEENLAQGREKFIARLEEDEDLHNWLQQGVTAALGLERSSSSENEPSQQ